MPRVLVEKGLSAHEEIQIIAEIPGPCMVTVENNAIAFTISGTSNITREELVSILNKHGLTVIEENDPVLGLDMGKTIEWYASAGIELPEVSFDLPCPIENPELVGLSEKELGGLLSLFPENARDRSIIRKVVGQPATWFHRDSTSEQPLPATKQEEALSPTAIIPSYIDYTPWGKLKTPTADVFLYQISDEAASEEVRKIVLSEGFVHEIGHSIVQPALYIDGYTLKFPDGKMVNGFDAILQFAELSEQHPPISHYASTYRDKDNKFESDDPDYNPQTAISEEMCETIAAYILGFAYCGDDSRGQDPFADRPEIKQFIQNFLNAEQVV